MALAGLDVGTSGCKFTIMDEQGQILGTAYHSYEAIREGGCHELDGNEIWEAVQDVIRRSTAQCPDVTVEAFAVTTLGESAFPLDENDQIIGKGTLCTDTRGIRECGEITEKLGGPERVVEVTGMVPRCIFTINKVMWLKNHTDIYSRTKKILLTEDLLIYFLTGKRLLSYSSAARTMALDVSTYQWSDEVFDAAGIDKHLFSPVAPGGTIAGTVKNSLAHALGLSPETKVCTGGMDQTCCAIGSGIFEGGVCLDVTGTCQCNIVFSPQPISTQLMLDNYLSLLPGSLPWGHYIFDAASVGGLLLQWYRDQLGKYEKEIVAEQQKDFFQYMDEKVRQGPSGLVILPDFAGYNQLGRVQRQGLFLGVTLETTSADIYKGLMESLAFRQRMLFDLLEEQGIPIHSVLATGGGSKSPVWLQLKADITGREYTALQNSEAGTIGCILLSGVALGKYKDLKDAAKNYVKAGKTYRPNMQRHQEYEKFYQRFRRLGSIVDDLLWDEIAK